MGGYIATGAPGRKEKRQKSQKPEAPASGLVDLAVWAGPAGSEARLYQLCHASWPGIVWLRSAKPPCKLYNSSRKTALSLHCVAQAPRSHGGSARPRLSSRQPAALAIGGSHFRRSFPHHRQGRHLSPIAPCGCGGSGPSVVHLGYSEQSENVGQAHMRRRALRPRRNPVARF